MPIVVVRHGKKWLVINKTTGKVKGTHPSARRAYAQIAAMKKNGVDISGKGE